MDWRRKFGNAGEDLAARYLEKKGIEIIERQYSTKVGEIDLVGLDGDEVVFVEVKTRKSEKFGYPEESVTPKKLEHIYAAGEMFLREKMWESRPFRVDVVSIRHVEGSEPEIVHFEGV